MGNGRSRSQTGIYAAIAAVAVTAGMGGVSAASASQDDAIIHADNGTEFVPSTVNIQPGDSVTWTFDNPTSPHNVVSKPDSPKAWSTGDAGAELKSNKDDVGPIDFPEAGTYTFYCQAHAGMDGTITVQDSPATATATPSPTTTPSPTAVPGPTSDTVKPTVRSVGLKALRRAVRVRFTLSEPATVTVRVKRRGSRKVLKSARIQAQAGTRTVTLRSKRLKKGRYTVAIQARDASGNSSSRVTKPLRVRG